MSVFNLHQGVVAGTAAAGGGDVFDSTLIGNSVWLDGSSDQLEMAKTSGGSASSKFTVSCWVQRNEFTEGTFTGIFGHFFSSNTGESKTISTTTSANLMNDVTLDEGTYTHAAILIKNALSYSAKIKFSPARTGKTGTGEWCWSLDGNTGTVNTAVASQATWIAECGEVAPSSFGSNSSSPNAIFSVASGNQYDNFETGTTASTSWTVYLLKADETLNTGTAGNYASFGTASYFLGIQQFNTAVSITPRTSNLDVGFRLEDTFRVETVENAGTHYIPQFGMGGFEFKVLTSE